MSLTAIFALSRRYSGAVVDRRTIDYRRLSVDARGADRERLPDPAARGPQRRHLTPVRIEKCDI
jgi:hypothetical protein